MKVTHAYGNPKWSTPERVLVAFLRTRPLRILGETAFPTTAQYRAAAYDAETARLLRVIRIMGQSW